jgi:hypothetical protein
MHRVDLHVVPEPGNATYTEAVKATGHLETQLRHTNKLQMKILAAVQDLEVRLEVVWRWVPEDEKWSEVSEMVRRQYYQHALHHLQGLIILRIFELAKCNMSGTGGEFMGGNRSAADSSRHRLQVVEAHHKGAPSALRGREGHH